MPHRRRRVFVDTAKGRVSAGFSVPETADAADVSMELRQRGWMPYRLRLDDAVFREKCTQLIRRSVFMAENPFPIGTKRCLNVVGRVKAFVAGCTIANFKIHDVMVGTINEVMRFT
jgi:hypothetical protein